MNLGLGKSLKHALYFANAVPGMTDTSLLPLAAEAAGMHFEDLVASMLAAAVATAS